MTTVDIRIILVCVRNTSIDANAEGAMKAAVIYTRVSTSRQAEDGISLDAQVSRATAWCAAMGYQLIGTFTDAGISGKRMETRPGLMSALDAACQGGAALVVYSLSRLARSTKDAIEIAARLDKAGADLVSLTEQIDTTTAAGKMVFRMMAVLVEFERDQIAERTKTALTYKRSQGYKTGGTVPFGYTVDDNGRLVEHEAEQRAITLIRSLREDGLTLREIAAELKGRGITTKTGGTVWQPRTIAALIDRKAA